MTAGYDLPKAGMFTSFADVASAHAFAASTRGAVVAKEKFDNALVRYDAWFVVFVAVILGLGATLLAGMAAWCVVNRHGRFTGNWHWKETGISVEMECAT